MTENIARYDKESDMYKILPGSYITTYLYDGSSGNLYITFASGKKVIFHNPSEIIRTKVKLVYEKTGAKLKKANQILNKKELTTK